MTRGLTLIAALVLSACGPRNDQGTELHVAAASNLQRVFGEIARGFEKRGGATVIPSFGATTQLAQQIENGGPFDVFLSADTKTVDDLVGNSLALEGSRAVYARGVLVLWAPKRADIRTLQDLARSDVKHFGIATPKVAPYGQAAIESLQALHLWTALESKAVYGPNVAVVTQFADSANVDASFTALALVVDRVGNKVAVSEELHAPIEQALCIVRATKMGSMAKRFRGFLLSEDGQAILQKFGYVRASSGYRPETAAP